MSRYSVAMSESEVGEQAAWNALLALLCVIIASKGKGSNTDGTDFTWELHKFDENNVQMSISFHKLMSDRKSQKVGEEDLAADKRPELKGALSGRRETERAHLGITTSGNNKSGRTINFPCDLAARMITWADAKSGQTAPITTRSMREGDVEEGGQSADTSFESESSSSSQQRNTLASTKDLYSRRHINRLYVDTGLKAAFQAVAAICHGVFFMGLAAVMQQNLLQKVEDGVRGLFGTRTEEKQSRTGNAIADSVSNYLNDLGHEGPNRRRKTEETHARRIILAACAYKSEESESALADRLCIRRGFMKQMRALKQFKDIPYVDSDSEEEIDEVYDDDDDDDDDDNDTDEEDDEPIGIMPWELLRHVSAGLFNSEQVYVPHELADDDSGDDDDEEDFCEDQWRQEDEAICAEAAKRARREAILIGLAAAGAPQKPRSDISDTTIAGQWWHMKCQYNTNTNKSKLVRKVNDRGVRHEEHRERLQTETTKVLYKEFRDSEEYAKHVSNGGGSIGFTLFKQAKCKCIKWDRLRKCADTLDVQFKEYHKAHARILQKGNGEWAAMKNCPCPKHQNAEYQEACKSGAAFIDFALCHQRERPELVRTRANLYDQATKEDQTRDNIAHADSVANAMTLPNTMAAKRKMANADVKPLHSMSRTVQARNFHIHDHGCSFGLCGECGVKNRLVTQDCPLEHDQATKVTFRKYIKANVTGPDGKVIGKTSQKVLTTVECTYEEFFEEYYAFLPTYFPHRWSSHWDQHHRKLLFDGLQWNMLAWHTDFSATYQCIGQDGATCEQPRSCIQQVFVVSYLEQDGEGNRVQRNDAWHFWGEIQKKAHPPSNFAYDNTCKKVIIEHYNGLFPGRFTRVCSLTDGCAEQYKSRHAAYEYTFLCSDYPFLMEYVQTFAPTAQFKCCCDCCGNDTKLFVHRGEINGQVRFL